LKVFLDTSALAKRYFEESGSVELESLFHSVISQAYVSTLAFPEFAAAVGRKLHQKELRKKQAEVVLFEFQKDWRDLFVKIPLDQTTSESAASFIVQFPLTGADAVHLASAEESDAELFIASDTRLLQSAENIGIMTYDPTTGTYPLNNSL